MFFFEAIAAVDTQQIPIAIGPDAAQALPVTTQLTTQLIWVDFVILGVIALSAAISVFRGFTREVLSLLAWIAAIVMAIFFAKDLLPHLTPYINQPSLRTFAAYTIIFIGTLIIGGMINLIVSKIIKKTGLSIMDRLLGIFFGAARGIILISVVVLLLGLTPIPQDPWWSQSKLIPNFQSIAILIKKYLPESVDNYFEFPALKSTLQEKIEHNLPDTIKKKD